MKNKEEQGMTTFEKLSATNVNSKADKKGQLTYLSWAWAWSEVKKACPDATYQMGETEYDEALGFMCHTSVTIKDETLKMWLPVLDSSMKAMLKVPSTYKGVEWIDGKKTPADKPIQPATVFDINKTMMRCLVKNLAMFGLGLYIYAGEDLPEEETEEKAKSKINEKAIAVEKKKAESKTMYLTLDVGDDNWAKVLTYIGEHKAKGLTAIVKTLSTKYDIKATVKEEISKAISDEK